MFEDKYGPCSEIVVGDQLKLNDTWYRVDAIAENADDAAYLDFTLADPETTVITWKNVKRVNYQRWVEA